MWRVAAIATFFCLVGAGSFAQETSSGKLPDAPSTSAQAQPEAKDKNALQSSVSFFQVLQQRSLMFPDLATGTGPLDPWQKFKLAANESVALSTIGGALVGAGFGQAINSPEGYGQGGEGYAKRFGANMARAASGQMFGTFLIASIRGEDPRFFVRKGLSFKESVKYAAERMVITRSDAGKPMTNLSGLLGPLAAEGLANTYYPEGNRGVGDTFTRYASDLGWQFGGNLLRQYWPEINRRLRLVPAEPQPAPAADKPLTK